MNYRLAVLWIALLLPGLLAAQCPSPEQLTVYIAPGNTNVWLHFRPTVEGFYRVWSTTDATYSGGFPATWTLEATVTVSPDSLEMLSGWLDPGALLPYKRYTLTHLCEERESPPGNQAGYVKISCNGAPSSAVYTPFGLPVRTWYVSEQNVPYFGSAVTFPSSIVGAQTFCGTLSTADRIVRQDNGQFGYRNSASSCRWAGSLETGGAPMEPARAYWYANKSGANRNLVLAGEADTTGTGIRTVNIPAPAAPGGALPIPYSWRDPRVRSNNQLNLLAQGFTGGTLVTSDRILSQIGGASFYYRLPDSTWQGNLTVVVPGRAYWIQNKHWGHPFSYTYNASGTP